MTTDLDLDLMEPGPDRNMNEDEAELAEQVYQAVQKSSNFSERSQHPPHLLRTEPQVGDSDPEVGGLLTALGVVRGLLDRFVDLFGEGMLLTGHAAVGAWLYQFGHRLPPRFANRLAWPGSFGTGVSRSNALR